MKEHVKIFPGMWVIHLTTILFLLLLPSSLFRPFLRSIGSAAYFLAFLH